jgi:hypothetical protein
LKYRLRWAYWGEVSDDLGTALAVLDREMPHRQPLLIGEFSPRVATASFGTALQYQVSALIGAS